MLLEHNIETYNQLCDTMDNYGHAMIIQTTGSGKSYIALEYIESNQFNTLVVVPTHIIGEQWCSKSELITYVCYDSFIKMNNFCSYDLVIFDEAHHLGAKTYEESFKKFIESGILYIGLTADSVRWTDSARDIANDYFSESTIYGLTLENGLQSGILPKIEYTVALYNPSEFASQYLKDKNINESLIAKLNYSIDNIESVSDILRSKLNDNIHGVLFVDSIDNIKSAYDVIHKTFGDSVSIYAIHSKHTIKYNSKQLELFKKTANSIIISVNMLNEGLHVDNINTIIMLRRTLSPNVYFQQLGRGISVREGGKLKVFDLVGNKNLLRIISSKDVKKTLIHGTIKNLISDQFIVDDKTIDILDVLYDIRNDLSDNWEKWEEEKIKSDYPEKGSDIPELIANGRSKIAIRSRARLLGVYHRDESKVWEEWEIERLKSDYPSKGPDIPELIANGRTKGAIRRKARFLGIDKYDKLKVWEEWEDNKIKSDYPEKGSNIPELKANGRTETAITTRANKLGVNHDSYMWLDWQDEKVKSDYPDKGADIPELLEAGKTKIAIKQRARKLGVKRLNAVNSLGEKRAYDKWQTWEDEKIKSDYPSKGSNIPELLANGRTREGIKTRACNLGIKHILSASWQSWEYEKIKSDYPSKGSNIPELLENGRTKASIVHKAHELGINKSGHKKHKKHE